MTRSFGIVGTLTLALTLFACSGAIGHGARPAPGPEAFGLPEETGAVKTANATLSSAPADSCRTPEASKSAGPQTTRESAAR